MAQQLTIEHLATHLDQVQQGAQALNTDLLDSFRLAGLAQLSSDQSQRLAVQLYRLLPVLREDPTPLCQLLAALLEPWPLHAILQIEPPVDFAAGLHLDAGPFNSLTLSLLEKGTADIASIRRLATTQPAIFTALLKLWLRSEDAGVASTAGHVIQALLKADRELDGSGLLPQADEDSAGLAADNPVWRRIFRDPDVYGVFFTSTDLSKRDSEDLGKAQVTIAQARLMEFMPKLAAMDWNAAVKSHIADIEASHGLNANDGLVSYTTTVMVDVKDDVLMHRSLISYYADLLESHSDTYPGSSSISPPLTFLLDHHLHDRTLKIYLKPDDPSHDPLDITFLYTAAAQYISTYATTCYWHFIESSAKDSVIQRLDQILNVPPSRWQSSPPAPADLNVLASIPRTLLMPSSSNGRGGSSSPLLAMPTRPTNADGLHTLAAIFHGPAVEHTFPARDLLKQDKVEMNAAPKLYFAYLDFNTSMWTDVVNTADTVAMTDTALAAITFVSAIVTANWTSVTSTTEGDGDTIMSDHGPAAANITGIEAFLMPPALTVAMPWVLRPPQQFSGLVGGRGDAEGAAFKVATAKFDCLKVVEKRLLEWMADGGTAVQERRGELERIAHALKERIREGMWGARGDVGRRIATLEL